MIRPYGPGELSYRPLIFPPVARKCEVCGREVVTPCRRLRWCDDCRDEGYARARVVNERRYQRRKKARMAK